ncbi:hypothetical protein [Actinocorallia aurantiaca]|uniref:Uncharacterized protein n=1 Tax=Actinocorallia aurantiaca TaxID=46204 RepID=A0ABN3UN61_9ACTN
MLVTMATAGAVAGTAPARAAEQMLPLREAAAALPVVDESCGGYVRTAFKHWIDEDRDSCSTRAEVLLQEAVQEPQVGERCRIGKGGRWYFYYNDVYLTAPGGLDIDHMVSTPAT